MYKKSLLTLTTIAALSFGSASSVSAGDTCQPQYGSQECPSVVVTLDKKVSDPNSDDNTTKSAQELSYVDNIPASDTERRYAPTEAIVFKLTVKNTSDQNVSNVVIRDKVPVDAVTSISGDGSFDAGSQIVTINVGDLGAQEEKSFYITGTIAGADKLPSDQDVVCAVNQSEVLVNNTAVDEDNATFCIERKKDKGGSNPPVTKGGKPVHPAPDVTSTPPTGPVALALLPIVGSATLGFILRRKSL